MTGMTVSEVATVCGVTERTVRRWLRDGRLSALRVGGRVRIPEHSVRELSMPYGSDHDVRPTDAQHVTVSPAVDTSSAAQARERRIARAERLLAMVRSMAVATGTEDAVALVRAGRDEQDDRWDPP